MGVRSYLALILGCSRAHILASSLEDNTAAIIEACKRDIGKPTYETYLTEIDWCKNDILFVCKHLPKWIKDETIPDMPLANRLVSPRVRKDPLGAVLIIGAYNFPVQLSIGPFVGAIAGGNTAVLKPSEQAPSVAMVLGKVISALDQSSYACLQGGVPETTALLDQKWDKIFYTGSGNVGKIIAKKAAETLTPVVLELGGRNPAIITKNADIRLAARRLLWGKVHNAGQVCISENYILVDKEVQPAFIRELKIAMGEFYPNGTKESADFSCIATERQWQRLKKLLDATQGKILYGGTMDEAARFLELTIVEVPDAKDPLIEEETFGPIISILPVTDLDQAIRIANEVDSTPLAAFAFGNNFETARVLRELRSGGASVNDGYFHASMPTAPFGGVGQSGQGSYRGKASFDAFTHRRTITKTPGWMESLLDIRYPPYTTAKLAKYRRMSAMKPNFDRDGKVKRGILAYLLNGKILAALLGG